MQMLLDDHFFFVTLMNRYSNMSGHIPYKILNLDHKILQNSLFMLKQKCRYLNFSTGVLFCY